MNRVIKYIEGVQINKEDAKECIDKMIEKKRPINISNSDLIEFYGLMM
jgi:hypothetical protein